MKSSVIRNTRLREVEQQHKSNAFQILQNDTTARSSPELFSLFLTHSPSSYEEFTDVEVKGHEPRLDGGDSPSFVSRAVGANGSITRSRAEGGQHPVTLTHRRHT